ncbi:diaminopimelate epimerase [Caldibacillus thermoamylovorans]|uniref:diaminopimelate epimerase n=1 Tax=Caldibacillus thermoamylovorans TaxID=35841 RepID=UPI001D08B76A|nr:diaminopimelate epimerase [Caldibacillus thermoamylovorans]MCB5935576.1 diaminopimelate epimerase [Bacillus sp. DFI.2.34]MCB7077727.1 diaminopimelate epimerase [Caldibacillus thermoamylovorans]
MFTCTFKKVHGSKNDFILIDEKNMQRELSHEEKVKLALLLCDRKTGIGADGILFVTVGGRTDGTMSIYNSDGTVASMCGNGLRVAGRYILEQTGKEEVIVETLKADLYVKKYVEQADFPFYQVEISPILFDPASLPMNTEKAMIINEKLPYLSENLTFTALAVPNPHLISIVPKEILLGGEQERIASFVNKENQYFPDGVNVSFIYPIQKGEIFVHTFERGVGFTNACGTAMSASSLVAILNGLHDYETPLIVYNNGGFVKTIVHKQDDKQWIDLIGNGTYEFDGKVTVDLSRDLMIDFTKLQVYEDEVEQYRKIEEKAKQKRMGIFGRESI